MITTSIGVAWRQSRPTVATTSIGQERLRGFAAGSSEISRRFVIDVLPLVELVVAAVHREPATQAEQEQHDNGA